MSYMCVETYHKAWNTLEGMVLFRLWFRKDGSEAAALGRTKEARPLRVVSREQVR